MKKLADTIYLNLNINQTVISVLPWVEKFALNLWVASSYELRGKKHVWLGHSSSRGHKTDRNGDDYLTTGDMTEVIILAATKTKVGVYKLILGFRENGSRLYEPEFVVVTMSGRRGREITIDARYAKYERAIAHLNPDMYFIVSAKKEPQTRKKEKK